MEHAMATLSDDQRHKLPFVQLSTGEILNLRHVVMVRPELVGGGTVWLASKHDHVYVDQSDLDTLRCAIDELGLL